MSKSVFLVFTGYYSDRGCCGVFTTREKAEACAAMLSTHSNDEAQIEEWLLDPPTSKRDNNLSLYYVIMTRGGLAYAWPASVSSYSLELASRSMRICKPVLRAFAGSDPTKAEVLLQEHIDTAVWARSDEHAIKIVNEKRAQVLAMNQWEVEE